MPSNASEYRFIEQLEFFIQELDLPLSYELIHNVDEVLDKYYDVLIIFEGGLFNNSLLKYCDSIILASNTVQSRYSNADSAFIITQANSIHIVLKILKILLDIQNDQRDHLMVAVSVLLELLRFDCFDFFSNTENKFKVKSKDDDNHNIFQNFSRLYLGGRLFYCEENKLEIVNATTGTFDLRRFHFLDVNSFRLDTVFKPCAISNYKFSVEYDDGQIIDLEEYINYTTNSMLLRNGIYYFDRSDPQFDFIKLPKINPLYFHFSLNVMDIANSAYYHKEQWVKEYQIHYQVLNDKGMLGGFWHSDFLENSHPKYNDKRVLIHLGSKAAYGNCLNSYLLDHSSEITQHKILYPTHQRQFIDSAGYGSLFTLFTRVISKNIIFDSNKSKWLLKDLTHGKFNFLLLSSGEFLEDERLRFIPKLFKNSEYVYYFINPIEFAFESYKEEIIFNNKTYKFTEYIYDTNQQFQHFFSIFKFLSPENFSLKEVKLDEISFNFILADLMNRLNHQLLKDDNNSRVNFTYVSDIVLEFKRLINFYPIKPINNNELPNFIRTTLWDYTKGSLNYIWLSDIEKDTYLNKFCTNLNVLFDVFNFKLGAEALENIKILKNRQFIAQELNSEQIMDVLSFFVERDPEKTLKLLTELKLYSEIKTDNEVFYSIIMNYTLK